MAKHNSTKGGVTPKKTPREKKYKQPDRMKGTGKKKGINKKARDASGFGSSHPIGNGAPFA